MIPRGYKVCGKEEIGSGVFSLYSLIKLVGGQRHRSGVWDFNLHSLCDFLGG